MLAEENKKQLTIAETIFEDLKGRIVKGEWKPSDRIPSESELCKITGASRVTVRAAIQKLSSLGLVETRQGGGTFVCELSGELHLNSAIPYFVLSQPDRVSMLEFRRIIEVQGAVMAAQRADAEQIASMHEATRKMAAATTTEEITRHDLEFHYLIMQASRNSVLVKVFEILRDTYFALLHENVTIMGSTGATYHKMIALAIESRDSELARMLMEKHLNNTIAATIKLHQADALDDGRLAKRSTEQTSGLTIQGEGGARDG
jgi:GntR family transcriptional repressor for pyruvate dehydrogenase complex